jgi:hypothetical protein
MKRVHPEEKGTTMSPAALPARVVALCADLFFAVGILRTAEALGLASEKADDLDDLVEKVKAPGPTVVVMELDAWRSGAAKRLREAHGDGLRILVFGSHVDRDTRAEAEREGCDAVMPRSAFAKDVAGHLRKWTGLSPESGGAP